MDLTTKLKRSESATHQTVEGEAVIINLNTGVYYSTNDTGTSFWELLDGEKTIGECAEVMAGSYEAPAEMIAEDLLELAADLEKEGLVVA